MQLRRPREREKKSDCSWCLLSCRRYFISRATRLASNSLRFACRPSDCRRAPSRLLTHEVGKTSESAEQIFGDALDAEGRLRFAAAGLKARGAVGPRLRSQIVVSVVSDGRELGARTHQTFRRDVQRALARRAPGDGLAVDITRDLFEVPILVRN